jgi:hypothetical protein
VISAEYSGTEIRLDIEDCLILDSDDLLGVVEQQRLIEGAQKSAKAATYEFVVRWIEEVGNGA